MSSEPVEEVSTEYERPDWIIPFNARSIGSSWPVNVITSDPCYVHTQAQAMAIIFNSDFNLQDAATLTQVNTYLHRLFQPKLNAYQSYLGITKHLYYAGPLEQLEIYIRQNPKALLETFNINNMRGTLVEIAIIGLDQTIIDHTGMTLAHGATEKLLQLHEELERQGMLPVNSYAAALEKASRAHLRETNEEKSAREANNIKLLEQLFDVFVGIPGDSLETKSAKITTEIGNFKKCMKSLKLQMMEHGIMKTNLYHLNLIHLIVSSFEILSKRGELLVGQQNGTFGNRFRLEVIGGAIQVELPPRLRQLLRKRGICRLFDNQQIDRDLDVNGGLFKTGDSWSNADYSAEMTFFYNDSGFGLDEDEKNSTWFAFYNLLQHSNTEQNQYFSLASDVRPRSMR